MFASGKTAAVASAANYIEDVFSTQVYTGTGATNNIVNGVDLATYGGLVWTKARTTTSAFTFAHALIDTLRGAGVQICSDRTDANYTQANSLTGFNTNGYTLGTDSGGQGRVNNTSYGTQTYVSWTFRKQPKFFDVVTFTATSSNDQRISHLLGSVPGCIMLKGVDVSSDWFVYHRSVNAPDARQYVTYLNSTVASQFGYGGDIWGASDPTSTDFGFKSGVHLTAGKQYVAYLFAHNAGGFGLTGTDNVISCGSFTTNGSGAATVSLGYEPQMLIVKRTDAAEDWFMVDNMRGWFASPSVDTATLKPNSSGAEFTWGAVFAPSATGFTYNYNPSSTYIYIAIRRGPMKVPTSGTSVFSPIAYAGNDVSNRIISGLINSPDLGLFTCRNAAGQANHITGSRLQGGGRYMLTESTSSESSSTAYGIQTYGQTSVTLGTAITNEQNALGINYILYAWQRAPSFFDEVCYTGTGTGSRAVTHNLGVAPQMVIVKQRTGTPDRSWWVLTTAVPLLNVLNSTEASNASGVPANLFGDATYNNYIAPTATTVTLSPSDEVNKSSNTYVAYLFATCAGVSKVGSYTGNGTTQTIDCGFTGGARFVLIKRTDSTGGWYVYDTARGMTTLTDPYLLLNSTAAESATLGSVTTVSTGFAVNASILAAINTNAASYIFLAIA